jgi:hypothetical protein
MEVKSFIMKEILISPANMARLGNFKPHFTELDPPQIFSDRAKTHTS